MFPSLIYPNVTYRQKGVSMDRLLTRVDVCALTGLSYVTLWEKMNRGEFPRSVALGPHPRSGVRWRLSAIEKWMKDLPGAPLKCDNVKRRKPKR